MKQIPLGVRLQVRTVFASVLPGGNLEAMMAMRALAAGSGERCVYLHGAPGSGKSHLPPRPCSHPYTSPCISAR